MFKEILSIIEKYDNIVIFGHINPDGDCYGSAVALKRSLSLKYPEKHIYIVGTGLPRFFDILMPMDIVDDETLKKSLAILVDANDLWRMEDQRVHMCAAFVKIDHHVDTGSFTEGPSVVDEDANSTCDMITEMIFQNNLPIDEVVANALYLGILTDSGRFQFVLDYPETFDRVSQICKCGADPKKLNRILTAVSEDSLQSKAYVYSNYKKTEDGVMYIIYRKETLKRLKIEANNASNLINLIGNVDGYPVWASFAEYSDGRVRVEFRSNGPVVQPSAMKIGGGGHMYASGATLPKFDQQKIDSIIEDLNQTVKEWKEGNN
ncbi:MAG: bifunctional oligoribonuclease/PAP phosphatase NrnA [Bacilli bacterium]|nr:bifunctional oligoribonuclease/PAP phosphatase NrnA [Bacilli bacterium]